MLDPQTIKRLSQALPFLTAPGVALPNLVVEQAILRTLSAGAIVFMEGDVCSHIALVLSGVVRVYRVGETGREITLYRFSTGESCILTANCILSQQQFPALAQVEQAVEAVLIPAPLFRDLVRTNDAWRNYVFDLLSKRLSTVMAVVNEVAFRRMDVRVADLLFRAYRPNMPPIKITHQQIALELGSAREVISRILEDFTAQHLVQSSRGTLTVLDPEGLARRATM